MKVVESMEGPGQDGYGGSVPSRSLSSGSGLSPVQPRWAISETPPVSGAVVPVVRRKGRKKVPPVDLNSVVDPEERKRQRRLMKNRETAAASRYASTSCSSTTCLEC